MTARPATIIVQCVPTLPAKNSPMPDASQFAVHFDHEARSNAVRDIIASTEPHSLRTFTPSQAVLAKSAGVFHWTPEGRRLYDFTSGVLVANLGHNPKRWMNRFTTYLGWNPSVMSSTDDGFFQGVSLTAYNAITELEAVASQRLIANLQASPGGGRLNNVIWAASGSEAVQKALWACMKRDPKREGIIATRFGFHGKKGLSGAVTGSESDSDRDPRVRFISFPREECSDIDAPAKAFDPAAYRAELDRIWTAGNGTIGCLITEPYLGGGGSFHPPKAYLQLLQAFCREHDILFILDEVQSNFGAQGTCMPSNRTDLNLILCVLARALATAFP